MGNVHEQSILDQIFTLGNETLNILQKNFTCQKKITPNEQNCFRKKTTSRESLLERKRYKQEQRNGDTTPPSSLSQSSSSTSAIDKEVENLQLYLLEKSAQSLEYLSATIKACVRIYSGAVADYVTAYQRYLRETKTLVLDRAASTEPLGHYSNNNKENKIIVNGSSVGNDRDRKDNGNYYNNDNAIVIISSNLTKDKNNSSKNNKIGSQNCQTIRRANFVSDKNNLPTSIDLNFSVKMLDWLLCILDNDENFSNLWTCLKSTANFEESTTNYDTPVEYSNGGLLGLGIGEKRYVINCELEMRIYATLDRLGKLELYDPAKKMLHTHMGQIKRFIHVYERAVNLKSDPELVAKNLSQFFTDVDTMAKNMFLVILMNVQPDQVNQAFDRIHSGIDTVKHEVLSILQNFRAKGYSANSANEKFDANYDRSSASLAPNVNTQVIGKERRRKRETEINGYGNEAANHSRSAKIKRTMKRLNVPGYQEEYVQTENIVGVDDRRKRQANDDYNSNTASNSGKRACVSNGKNHDDVNTDRNSDNSNYTYDVNDSKDFHEKENFNESLASSRMKNKEEKVVFQIGTRAQKEEIRKINKAKLVDYDLTSDESDNDE